MTNISYPISKITDLKDMLRQSQAKFGERTAFLSKPIKEQPYVPISYNQYANDVEALGTALWQDLNLDQGSATGLLGESQYEWYVSYLAVVNGASIIVPLDKELPPQELANLICTSHIKAIIIAPVYHKKLAQALQIIKDKNMPGLALEHIISMGNAVDTNLFATGEYNFYTFKDLLDIGYQRLDAGNKDFANLVIDPDELRILLFTSGTTSSAKAVMHNHRTIVTNLMAMCRMVLIDQNDVFFSVLPLHHTYECTCGFLCPIYRGASIAQCEGLRYILPNLQEAKATVMLVVPLIAEAFYKKIVKAIRYDFSTHTKVQIALTVSKALQKVGVDKRRNFFSKIIDQFGGALRLLIIGGAKVKPEVIDAFNSFGLLTIQGYGLTECAPIIALNHDQNHRSFAAGQALPGVDIKVLEPNEDGIGEFIAKGDNIMLGYYNDQTATKVAIDKDGYFHTGDLGYIDAEGFLVITGRKKNVIITANGKNIYPEEIEFILAENSLIQEVVVSGSFNAKGETIIQAEIFPNFEEAKQHFKVKAAKDIDRQKLQALYEELVKKVNHTMPTYKAIRVIKIREVEFEKNTSKKIKRF